MSVYRQSSCLQCNASHVPSHVRSGYWLLSIAWEMSSVLLLNYAQAHLSALVSSEEEHAFTAARLAASSHF